MVVRFVPNDLDHDRYGISTGRRLGGAVARNRVRRRLREILRCLDHEAAGGWDVLIVARPASASATFAELRATLERLLRSVWSSPVRASS
jgi:ribonuclease P protein component